MEYSPTLITPRSAAAGTSSLPVPHHFIARLDFMVASALDHGDGYTSARNSGVSVGSGACVGGVMTLQLRYKILGN